MMKNAFRTPAVCLVALVLSAGCDGQKILEANGFSFVPDLAFTPAGADAVSKDAARFSAADDHPLTGVTPGTVIDDLAKLDGCWGTYEVYPIAFGLALYNADFYHADMAKGEITFQRLQSTPIAWPGVPEFEVAVEAVYSFEVTGPDRILLTDVLSSRISSNLTLRDGLIPPVIENPIDQPHGELFFSVEGDSMSTYNGEQVSVFTRMDCPQ